MGMGNTNQPLSAGSLVNYDQLSYTRPTLIETLDNDDFRRDMANMMNILSQEFTRHMKEQESALGTMI
jgi:hypothetical protein